MLNGYFLEHFIRARVPAFCKFIVGQMGDWWRKCADESQTALTTFFTPFDPRAENVADEHKKTYRDVSSLIQIFEYKKKICSRCYIDFEIWLMLYHMQFCQTWLITSILDAISYNCVFYVLQYTLPILVKSRFNVWINFNTEFIV